MPKKRKNDIPRMFISEDASLEEIYAQYRKEFTAADLQQYTELEEGIPIEQILAEMEAIQHGKAKHSRKKA